MPACFRSAKSRAALLVVVVSCFFFFNDTATTEIYTLSLHDALPIRGHCPRLADPGQPGGRHGPRSEEHTSELQSRRDLVCRLLLEKKKNDRHTQLVGGDLREDRLVRLALGAEAGRHRHRPVGTHLHGLLFFFNDTATTEIYTLSLHDALPI